MLIKDEYRNSLDYKDVFIIPQYSEVSSRKLVDTSSYIFDNLNLAVPVISANMDTVTESTLAREIHVNGGIGALHRFMSIEQNTIDYLASPFNTLVSIGVNGDSRQRAKKLYEFGARYFVVDIAHGHSKAMKEMIVWLKSNLTDIKVMAGNVATLEGVDDLSKWGADAVKIGIGPGAACLTKNVTGVTVPQWSALQRICHRKFKDQIIIADGGITEIGDIAKAIGIGADAVMTGRLFAACRETPGPRVNGKKVYRGMASKDAMLKIKPDEALPTPEGDSIVLDDAETTVAEVMAHIKGGLQSAMSYCNSTNIKEFQKNVMFGTRR